MAMGDLGGTKALKHSKQYFATMSEPTKEGKAALKPSSASSFPAQPDNDDGAIYEDHRDPRPR
jgi:hypothetical protein